MQYFSFPFFSFEKIPKSQVQVLISCNTKSVEATRLFLCECWLNMNGFIDECILRTSSEDVCGGRLEDARVGREEGSNLRVETYFVSMCLP